MSLFIKKEVALNLSKVSRAARQVWIMVRDPTSLEALNLYFHRTALVEEWKPTKSEYI